MGGSATEIAIPCQFQAPGGWYYDLSGLRKDGDYNLGVYRWNICQTAECVRNDRDSTVCERIDNNLYWSLGTLNTTQLMAHYDGPDKVELCCQS